MRTLWYDESGLTTIEYALVLGILGLACFAVGTIVSSKMHATIEEPPIPDTN